MELDTRFWSIFIYFSTTIMLLCALSTPYDIKGVVVPFGEHGLWRVNATQLEAEGKNSNIYTVAQVLVSLGVCVALFGFIGYIMLCRSATCASQSLTIFPQFVAGILLLIGTGVFATNVDHLGEGWWMALASGVLYILNGIVILAMPLMDFDTYKQAPNKVIV